MGSISRNDLFGFDVALIKLKKGQTVGRVAWATYRLEIVKDSISSVNRNPKSSATETMKFIVAIDCLNRVIPWNPTHSDLLAEDWITWEKEDERLEKRNYFEVITLEQFKEQGSFICASPFNRRYEK